MINKEPVEEMFTELDSVNRDIYSLRMRLNNIQMSKKVIDTNLRVLKEALQKRHDIMELIKQEYIENISLSELMKDINGQQ